jgi:prophage tail gpP-like protein
MSIVIIVDGTPYEGFYGVSVADSVDNLCAQYFQECTSETGGNSFPIKHGADVKIEVEDVEVFSGKTEKAIGSGGGESYQIKTEGRDSNLVILKEYLDSSVSLKGPISLKKVIEKTLKVSGIKRRVIDETSGIDYFTRRELLNDDVGTKLWDYWIELARKRQVLITGNRANDIIIYRPGQNKYSVKLCNRKNDRNTQNNIIRYSFEYNSAEMSAVYVVHSQYNFSAKRSKAAPIGDALADKIFDTDQTDTPTQTDEYKALEQQRALVEIGSDQYNSISSQMLKLSTGGGGAKRSRVSTMGVVYNPLVTDGSTKRIKADVPSDDDECKRLAEWYCNLDRAKSISYSCVTPILSPDGEPWKKGYLVDVEDDDADIDATMLISNVEFSISKTEDGNAEEIASLTLKVPDAFSENAVVDKSLVRINRIGANWNQGVFM